MFQKNDAAKFKSESLQKLLKSDQVSDLDKLYISAGISAPKDNIIPFLSKLLATCKLLTKANVNDGCWKINESRTIMLYRSLLFEANVEVLQGIILLQIKLTRSQLHFNQINLLQYLVINLQIKQVVLMNLLLN